MLLKKKAQRRLARQVMEHGGLRRGDLIERHPSKLAHSERGLHEPFRGEGAGAAHAAPQDRSYVEYLGKFLKAVADLALFIGPQRAPAGRSKAVAILDGFGAPEDVALRRADFWSYRSMRRKNSRRYDVSSLGCGISDVARI